MISIGQWITATGGLLIAPEQAHSVMLNGLVHDSRAVRPGCCFACIKGEHVDGHDFAQTAAQNGAALILAERNPFGDTTPPVPTLLVDNTVTAMGRAAAFARSQSKATVIGVTGTAGKTTVKELLAGVCSTSGITSKNPLNLNNQIGLPESMLNADPRAVYWVMEAGISQADDMDELGPILSPDIALVLNVGAGHTEGLGDRGVAACKSRLFAHLAQNGVAFACADYPELVQAARAVMQQRNGKDIVFFSAHSGAAPYTATYAGTDANGHGLYDVAMNGERATLSAPFQGAFWTENIAAVAAVAHHLGFDAAAISAGFFAAHLPPQRNSVRRAGRFTIIDDTYNANPLSARRMIEAAREQAGALPLILVLGEMLELGENARAEHEELGRHLAQNTPTAVFWKGGHGEAVQAGMQAQHCAAPFISVANGDELCAAFTGLNCPEALVLFKGSRGNRLENLLQAFENRAVAATAGQG